MSTLQEAVNAFIKGAAHQAGKVAMQRLLQSMGVVPQQSTARLLLDEYLQRLQARLDEDRLAKLYGAFSMLKDASRMPEGSVKRVYLSPALGNFHEIASISEQGVTGGFQNSQLCCLAVLGMAAAHITLGDSEQLIAEKMVEAVYIDPSTAEPFLGKDFVDKIRPLLPKKSTGQTGMSGLIQPKLTRERIQSALQNRGGASLDLTGQDLSGLNLAGLDLRTVVFRKANLRNAVLSDSILGEGWPYDGADLRDADLSQANLSRAMMVSVNLNNANLQNANLTNACLNNASLNGANLRGANLASARLGCDLTGVNLDGANLENITLKFFSTQTWRRVSCQGANLQGATIGKKIDLRECNFRNANLRNANLYYADLRQSILQGAKLQNADMRYSDLRGVNLQGADLNGAKLAYARYHSGTEWPQGFDPFSAGALLDGPGWF